MAKRSKKKPVKTKEPEVKSFILFPFLKKHPDWVAMGALLVLLLIFFGPVIFEGKTLLPPDSLASKCFTPLVDNALKDGTYPLWNPYIYGGMPSFASLTRAPFTDPVQTVIYYGIVWVIQRVLSVPDFLQQVLNYLLFGGTIYLLLRSKKLSPAVAFFGSMAMVFMPQVVAYSAFGHSTKLKTAALIPLIFLLLERLLKKRNLVFFSLFGLAVGLQLLRAHVQICFYTQLMVGIYFIFWVVNAIKDKRKVGVVLQGGGLLLGALIVGVMLSAVLNLSVMEYADYSIRGGGETGGLNYDYATNWSFPPTEITTYFIPAFMGFGRDTYWGPMIFTDMPLYFGIVIFLLAGLALAVNRNRTTWFFGLFALIVLFISFGKHLPILYGPMFKFLPFFNKFRAPKMIQVMFQFSMVVLAGFGLQGIVNLRERMDEKVLKNIKRYMMIFGAILFLLFFILLVGKSAYLGWAAKARSGPEAAYDRALGDGFKALLFFGIAAAVVLMAVQKKIKTGFLIILVSALAFIDYWIVNKQFVEFRLRTEQSTYFKETEDVRFLKGQDGTFRILQVADQRTPNWYAYHGIENIGGYQGAKLRVYQELIDAFNMPHGFFQKYLKVEDGQYVWRETEEIPWAQWQKDQAFLRLTNVRYIVSPYPLPDPTLAMVSAPQVRGQNGVLAYQNALPRVYFPEQAVVVEGKEAVLGMMSDVGYDPGQTAIVEEALPAQNTFSENNMARIVDYSIHRVDIEADVESSGLMVLSDMYYPVGWNVYVDGEESKIYKTNWAFRSVFLESGSHTVTFRFDPKMPGLGLMISIIVFCLLSAGVAIGLILERKKRQSLLDQ